MSTVKTRPVVCIPMVFPMVFPMGGVLFVAFICATGWRIVLAALYYVCPGCGDLHGVVGLSGGEQ